MSCPLCAVASSLSYHVRKSFNCYCSVVVFCRACLSGTPFMLLPPVSVRFSLCSRLHLSRFLQLASQLWQFVLHTICMSVCTSICITSLHFCPFPRHYSAFPLRFCDCCAFTCVFPSVSATDVYFPAFCLTFLPCCAFHRMTVRFHAHPSHNDAFMRPLVLCLFLQIAPLLT